MVVWWARGYDPWVSRRVRQSWPKGALTAGRARAQLSCAIRKRPRPSEQVDAVSKAPTGAEGFPKPELVALLLARGQGHGLLRTRIWPLAQYADLTVAHAIHVDSVSISARLRSLGRSSGARSHGFEVGLTRTCRCTPLHTVAWSEGSDGRRENIQLFVDGQPNWTQRGCPPP